MRAASLSIAALILLPFALGEFWAYQLGLYFLYACAAIGVGLCWGQAGFLPLGQGMFFGIAAYLSGFSLIVFEGSLWTFAMLGLAAAASGLLAYAIGALVLRSPSESGPFFSMITLALSLLAFQLANSWNEVTGGFNGLKGIPSLPGLDDISATYYVSAIALVFAGTIGFWLVGAPIGVLWRALAQNERRVALFGFDTNRLKAVAFGISGLLAGIGGAIYAPQQGLVTPQLCGFALSADLVIWAAVGGRGRLLGPVVGTVVVGVLSAELRDRIAVWEVLMAAFFLIVVLAFPQGIIGLISPVARWILGHPGRKPAIMAPGRSLPRGAARLALDRVSAHIGDVTILDGLSLVFNRPGIFCIIGPNGAGKTSTFNLVTSELEAAAGRVVLDHIDLAMLPSHLVARLGVARKLQIPSIFPDLTIRDNLAIALWSGQASRLDLLRPSLRRWTSPMMIDLARRYPFLAASERRARELSHGERQILELAMALLTEPRILLLDEPCAGLSPEETAAVIEVIRWAGSRLGGAIIVIEHDMSLVKELAETVYVLHNGTLLAQGSVAEIQANPAVQAVYVGGQK